MSCHPGVAWDDGDPLGITGSVELCQMNASANRAEYRCTDSPLNFFFDHLLVSTDIPPFTYQMANELILCGVGSQLVGPGFYSQLR